MIAILGGGISGISAGYHLGLKGKDAIVFEKNKSWGGLCDQFVLNNGYVFDYFVHLSFTNSSYVKDIFSQSSDFFKHHPLSMNYYNGYWIKHPAQNNLSPLPTSEKVQIIADFINKPTVGVPQNYRDWLLYQFGEYFTVHFPEVYTRKYWTLEAEKMTLDWVGSRFSLPKLEDLLYGAFEERSENFYYAKEMRYPVCGGYKSFLTTMASQTNIQLNKCIELVDLTSRRLDFSDGTNYYYESLVSSLPLPELVRMIKDVPAYVLEAANKLQCTSGQLVSLGFNRPDVAKNLWFYIYDNDILPSRAYSPSMKSINNVPEGKSSLQFETYFSNYTAKRLVDKQLLEHVIDKGHQMKLWSPGDIDVADYREVKYANVIFDHDRKNNLAIVHHYLNENGIKYIGRFGEWGYLWSDQSLLSGKSIENYYEK